jgi:phosphoglycerate dehydrogenase-like enzyme
MDNNTVLVLANPTDPQLAMLEGLPPETHIVAGNTIEVFARAAEEASVILNWSGPRALLRQVFVQCPRVRWVHSRAAGLDDLLFPELVESAVPLTNSMGVFSPPLGEWVLGAILFFAKDFRRLLRQQAAGEWKPFYNDWISGRTVGIVGFGDIGRTVAVRVRAMGMRVLGLRRRALPPGHAEPLADRIYGPDGKMEMLALCDYLVVTAPLTPETRGMIGANEIAALPPHAVAINIGRGPVIDEPALVAALTEKRIRGAALDVFETEPLPPGHAFFGLDNVLLSPHSADHVPDWLDRAMQFFLDQYQRFRNGEPLLNAVDKRRGY